MLPFFWQFLRFVLFFINQKQTKREQFILFRHEKAVFGLDINKLKLAKKQQQKRSKYEINVTASAISKVIMEKF